jgi:acyl dehydratase
MPQVRYYDQVKVGDKGTTPEVTVTKEMIRAYADLSGDQTPIHTDEEYARASHFGGLVAHGLFGLSLTDGLKTQSDLCFPPGASLGWTWDFRLPIYADDRLHVEFQVESMRTTKKPDWGILFLACNLINQNGEVVQNGMHKLMIRRYPDQ